MEHLSPLAILPAIFGTLIPIAGIAMIVLIVYFEEKRKAKQSLYRSELLKKIADSQGDAADKIMEMIRQEELDAKIRRREGIKLGGMITAAAGLGAMALLFMLVPAQPVWVAGVVPLLIGLALFIYAQTMAPKPDQSL